LPDVPETLGGVLFLAAIGLAFWVIYFTKRELWWAVIPGGAMFTLALVAGLESVFEGAEMGGVFFLGLGLTFVLLYFVPTPQGRMKWALIPAAVLLTETGNGLNGKGRPRTLYLHCGHLQILPAGHRQV